MRAKFFLTVCSTLNLKWPEPIYTRVGYVLESRFSAEKI